MVAPLRKHRVSGVPYEVDMPAGWQYDNTSVFKKKMYDGADMSHWRPLYTQAQLEAAVQAERERCIRIAELAGMTTVDVARAIREGVLYGRDDS